MCRLGDIAIKVGSGITPKGGNSVYKQFGHYFVRSQNIGNGHLLLNDIAFIDNATHHKQISTEIKVDDVLLNITGASIGRCAIATQQIEGGNVNQHVCIIRLKSIANPIYICNFILSNKGQKQIDSFQAGGNRQGLNFEQIKTFLLHLPCRIEQDKLAKLLSLLDSRLSTQNKIIEQLESLIKGLCRILIISKTPNTKIKSCLECHSSTLSESDIEEDGGICNVYGATGVIAKTSKYQIDKSSILIIKDGAGVGRVQYAEGRYSVLGTLNYLTAKNGYFLKYLYYFLSIFNFGRFVVGSGIPHIYFKDYGEAECYCPSLATQYKIANALTAVTEKIEIERRLLQKMKEQKQYLISNLFI